MVKKIKSSNWMDITLLNLLRPCDVKQCTGPKKDTDHWLLRKLGFVACQRALDGTNENFKITTGKDNHYCTIAPASHK